MADLDGLPSAKLAELIRQPYSQAAVLVGLVERAAGLQMLLTERSQDLRSHPGQVSFPGGRVEQQDADHWQAALREAREEIGLLPELVAAAGYLETYLTVTGYVVTPVVGFVDQQFQARPDGLEVDEVFEVPLDFLFDPANLTVNYRERLGSRFRIYEYDYCGHRIWGATAAMIVGFRRLITGESAPK